MSKGKKQLGGSCASNLVVNATKNGSVSDVFSMLGLPKIEGGMPDARHSTKGGMPDARHSTKGGMPDARHSTKGGMPDARHNTKQKRKRTGKKRRKSSQTKKRKSMCK